MKTSKIFASAFGVTLLLASCAAKETKTEGNMNEAPSACEAVIENIMTRTSIRQFTDQQIGKDTLETLVKAGMAAPSAMNKQPWAFVVVNEREILDSLNIVHPYSNLKTATAAIIVCGNMQKTIEGEGREYWVQDCSAATENILLAAHGCGLGAVWCGVYPSPERVKAISEVLGLPEYIIPLNIISMGYPAENPEPKDKWNPDNIRWQKWSE